jgi:hypothetical protein
MRSFQKFAKTPEPRQCVLLVCGLPCGLSSQARTVNATVDTSKTGAPISENIYGQFLEHGGDIVNTGVWSEMLVDRKFFYPVAASAPTPPPVMGNAAGNPRFRHKPTPIGGDNIVTVDTKDPYSNRTEAVLNPTKMYRDHFRTIPVEVAGNSPQPKPTFPAGGDQPTFNPGSDTYPLDISAALSEDRKTLSIAVLNPSDSEQNINLAITGTKLASSRKLWRMAPDSIDATVQVDKKPELQVEEQTLGALLVTITVRPFSVNSYSYPCSKPGIEEDPDEIKEAVACMRVHIDCCNRTLARRPGANNRSGSRSWRKAGYR